MPPGCSRGAGAAPCGQARVPLAVLRSFAGAACPGRLPACSQPRWEGTGKGRDRFQGKRERQPKKDQLEPTGSSTHPRENLSVIQPGSKLVSFVVVWTLSETCLNVVFNWLVIEKDSAYWKNSTRSALCPLPVPIPVGSGNQLNFQKCCLSSRVVPLMFHRHLQDPRVHVCTSQIVPKKWQVLAKVNWSQLRAAAPGTAAAKVAGPSQHPKNVS